MSFSGVATKCCEFAFTIEKLLHKIGLHRVYQDMSHFSSAASIVSDSASSTITPFAEAAYDILVSFDGALEPRGTSRARGSWGYVVVDAAGNEIQRDSSLMPAGGCTSNNVAEYTALLKAMDWVKTHASGQNALFQGDSQLVVHHCRETWGWNTKKTRWNPHKKAPHLLPLLRQAMDELAKFPALSTQTLAPGPDPKANALPIVWVAGAANPADGESRKPLVAAGLWMCAP